LNNYDGQEQQYELNFKIMKRKALIAMASLIGLAGFSQITCDQIKTVDGRIFKGVKLRHIEPDGISISYEPATGGIGIAKLKFAALPQEIRQRFGYDSEKASANVKEAIAGGAQSTAIGPNSTVGGGFQNTAAGGESTVSGGARNAAPRTES
jgi:hypothetical protein